MEDPPGVPVEDDAGAIAAADPADVDVPPALAVEARRRRVVDDEAPRARELRRYRHGIGCG
jgi:hypothetical protein